MRLYPELPAQMQDAEDIGFYRPVSSAYNRIKHKTMLFSHRPGILSPVTRQHANLNALSLQPLVLK